MSPLDLPSSDTDPESQRRIELRDAVESLNKATNRASWGNFAKSGGAIPPYTPPVFDPRLADTALEYCQANAKVSGGYCSPENVRKEAVAKAAVDDRLAYDKAMAAGIAANFANNAAYAAKAKESAIKYGVYKEAQDSVAAAAQAAAIEVSKQQRLDAGSALAVKNGTCGAGIHTDAVNNSDGCKKFIAAVNSYMAKGLSRKEAIEKAKNPEPPKSLVEASKNLGKAVDASKAAQAKLGHNGSKAKGGKKPDFKKQMARAKGRSRGR